MATNDRSRSGDFNSSPCSTRELLGLASPSLERINSPLPVSSVLIKNWYDRSPSGANRKSHECARCRDCGRGIYHLGKTFRTSTTHNDLFKLLHRRYTTFTGFSSVRWLSIVTIMILIGWIATVRYAGKRFDQLTNP